MSTKASDDTQQQPIESQSETESTFERFRRSVSGVGANAKSYFSQLGNAGSPTPDANGTVDSSATQSSIPGNGPRKPTAFERFVNVGKVTKDWAMEWPPRHWVEDTGGVPALPPTDRTDLHADTEAPVQDAEPSPEPAAFAEQIRSILATSPQLVSPNGSTEDGSKGNPAPPKLIINPQLVKFLSSPEVMNGSASKEGRSVWSSLDRLRAVIPGQSKPSTDILPEKTSEEGEHAVDDDDSSVMVYGPLFPTESSEVELAQSEVIPEPRAEGSGQDAQISTSRLHLHHGKSKRIWIPSRDKISVQVMWWGYRIYLPPSVLEVLDDKQIEGAKRAALLTAALKWALDRVPMMILPPQARPAMKMLKTFTPYLGYVGAFVAWSWGSIKGFDKGSGVTLTATWLLTIAVVPGTWEDEDFPTLSEADRKQGTPQTTPGARTPQTEGRQQHPIFPMT